MTTSEYTTRTKSALASFGAKQQASRMQNDWSKWPSDITAILEETCELWYLRAPATKKSKSYWIQSARELLDACGEFGTDCLKAYRKDFEDYMRTHNGIAMHTVEGPGSLVKMVRDKARQLREQNAKPTGYRGGEFAEWITN